MMHRFKRKSVICRFYCIAFVEYTLTRKTLLDYIILFFTNDYKENDKMIYKYFRYKYGKPWLSTKKIEETGNYLSEEIKHNDLMSKKHKKVCRYLNCFEYFLVFISAISSYI